MEDTTLGLGAWNYQITNSLRAILYTRTNNGIITCDAVNKKVEMAIMLVEEFENLKQGTLIKQLSKHAMVCKKEAEALQAVPKWKFWAKDDERLKLLWTSYSVYENAMAIILDTLPTDMQELLQSPSVPATGEPSSGSSSTPSEPQMKIERGQHSAGDIPS